MDKSDLAIFFFSNCSCFSFKFISQFHDFVLNASASSLFVIISLFWFELFVAQVVICGPSKWLFMCSLLFINTNEFDEGRHAFINE